MHSRGRKRGLVSLALLGMGLTSLRLFAAPAVSAIVLGSGTHNGRAFQKLRLTWGARAPTYAVWFPPLTAEGIHGAVVLAEPYVGIDWTGEPADAAFAALPDAGSDTLKADAYGPGYLPGVSGPIVYRKIPEADVYSEAYAYLTGGLGVLFVFERFYAGGDLLNDALDTATALQFLSEQPEVEAARTGIYGASLGGFCAVHGSALADAAPAYGAAWSPPVDMAEFAAHVTSAAYARVADPAKKQVWAQVLDPYRRRMAAVPGAPGAYASHTAVAVASALRTNFLLLHDDWDTLVPVENTRALLAAAPARTTGFLVPRPGPIDFARLDLKHSPVPFGGDVWYAFTMVHAYLLTRLMPPGRPFTSLYHAAEMEAFMDFMSGAQRRGVDISPLAPRLLDLCDERVSLLDMGDLAAPTVAGRAVVARWLNAHWGTRFSPAEAVEFLRRNGMPKAVGGPSIQKGRPAAYPAPFRLSQGTGRVALVNFPKSARVRLFAIGGAAVRELYADETGTLIWDGRDEAGGVVASGVYLASGEGMERPVKIIVQR